MSAEKQLLGLALVLMTGAAGCAEVAPGAPRQSDGQALSLELTEVVDGLRRPVHLTAPEGDDRLFIIEKSGRILIVQEGSLLSRPFLDLSSRVSGRNEQGLLSVAFHPEYRDNGQFFVDFTDSSGATRVERYEVSGDPNRADPTTAMLIMTIQQPFSNHNGGHVLFGPDGMLYVASGDGGAAGDPQDNGQNRTRRLGSILRVDVDHGLPFTIPDDNPFVGHPSFLPEIWLWGVRNPWRIAFDPVTGDLYVADVGQGRLEEITVVRPDQGGANLGWKVMEGTECFGGVVCDPSEFVLPQVEYDHGEGCSITGGHVYRGRIEALRGVYFYSDYCSGWLRSFRMVGGIPTEPSEWDVPHVGDVTSFGEDGHGELYMLTESAVFRLDEATP